MGQKGALETNKRVNPKADREEKLADLHEFLEVLHILYQYYVRG